MKCSNCGKPVGFATDPYDLPEGVGMAVEHGGRVLCAACFYAARKQGVPQPPKVKPTQPPQPPTCRRCGRPLARGEVGLCKSCFWEEEQRRFPECGRCGALLPRSRGLHTPLTPWIRVTVGVEIDHLDPRDTGWIQKGSAGRDKDVPICLACASRYTSEEGWLWRWEEGRLWILSTKNWDRRDVPDLPSLQRAREEALQELERRIREWGELPPR